MAQLWFSFWANEYLSDGKIRVLTYEKRGILQTLWAFAWNDGSIPSDPEELGVMLGIPTKTMRSHCEWITKFFIPHHALDGRMVSPRLEIERIRIEAKGAKASDSARVRWDKQRNANAYANASETHMRTPCVDHATQTQKEITNPLPPTGSGEGGKKSRKPSWQNAHPAEVIQATQEIKAFWPTPAEDKFQPDMKTLVPGVSTSELASRLADIKASGADLAVCVKVARRYVSEWEKGGPWIKAPQNFFGKAKDAPYKAYYQAYVTNSAIRLAEVS